jgi:hypothetical protein
LDPLNKPVTNKVQRKKSFWTREIADDVSAYFKDPGFPFLFTAVGVR